MMVMRRHSFLIDNKTANLHQTNGNQNPSALELKVQFYV